MGGAGGQNWELDSFHAHCCKDFRELALLFLYFTSRYLTIAEQVKILFTGERRDCDQIFDGLDSLRDQCFAECTTGSVLMLLSFGDAIAKSKRSPEKLFVLLDMYEIMREIHSEV